MAHKREEETELKLPKTPPLTCTPIKSPEPITKPAKSPDPSSDLPSRPRPRSGISQKFPTDPENNKNNIIKKITLNRCAGCRKKVGLTGFRCRCGELFCTEHRYSDRHECSYDYKAAGREAIARDNPVVRPAKLLKV